MKARLIAVVCAGSMLAGCVTPPHLGPAVQPKPASSYATAQTFAAASADWPSDHWWEAYGDPQLTALIAEGLAGSPTLAQGAARLRRAQALADLSASTLLPSVSADASASLMKPSTENGIPVTPERRGYNDFAKASLGFAWELDFWGKNRASLAASTSEAYAAAADSAAARLLLSATIAATYADLARLFADRDVVAGTLAVRERSLALVRARFVHGFDSAADLAQAEAGPPAARSDLAGVDEAIALARNRLAALLGAGPDRGRSIGRPASPHLAPLALPARISTELLARRPEVVAARWRAEAAARRIDVAHAQFYPNINLLGFLGFDALGLQNIVTGGADTGSLGAVVSLPIFDGGRRRAGYSAARSEYEVAVAAYNEVVTQSLRDVADAVGSRAQLARQQAGAAEALDATERAYRLAELRYRSGADDYQSVLLVEDRLLARRRIVTNLQSRGFILDIALVRALGGGFVGDQKQADRRIEMRE